MSNQDGMDLGIRLAYLEEANLYKMQALRLTRDLGAFHASINQLSDPVAILEKCREQGMKLIRFKTMAFFLVNEETSDFDLIQCMPDTGRQEIETELEKFIEDGTFSRAVLDKTPVVAHASHFKSQFLFHVLATSSRVRGMFAGVLEKKIKHVPEASMELFSILMSHCAHALESFELYHQLKQKVAGLTASEARLKKTTADKLRAERARHKLEEKLWQARKMESIGLLASGTAHDFNNLLNVILNCNELLLKKIPVDAPAHDLLKKTETACQRAMDLAKKLYTIGREDRHDTHVVNAADVVAETLRLLRSSLGRSIEIISRIKHPQLRIMAEETRLQQVLMNLITNSAHAMEKGRITVVGEQVTLTQKQRLETGIETDQCIRISVTDSGPGMEPEVIPRVFDPYFSTKRDGDNAGLGLTMVHSIVKQYKGAIEVDSVKGRGTSFHIYIPRIADGGGIPDADQGGAAAAGHGN